MSELAGAPSPLQRRHGGVPAVGWWRQDRAVLALLVAGALVLFVFGLGTGTLWDQDEARYTQIAREILQTGDPITLHENGQPWFVHPPLYMWLTAATGWLFGFTEFTARVWSAIFGVVGVYATYLLGRMLFGPRAAALGAVVLMTTLQYFVQSRLAVFDVSLVAFMLLSVYAFLRGVRERQAHLVIWAAGWAGLATLTKGPIGLLLPAMVMAAFAGLRRGLVPWRQIPWVKAGLVYATIGLSWYLAEWILHGPEFARSVIGYYTVNRFVGTVEGQSGAWWYYAPVFGLGAFPWTAFLLAMIPYHLGRRGQEGSLLVLLWCGITVAFYTVAGTKLPNYVLPVYPVAALGIAAMWDRFLDGEGRARRYVHAAFAGTALALVVLAAEVAAFGRATYAEGLAQLQAHLLAVAVGAGAVLALATLLHLSRRPAASFAAVAGAMVLLGGIVVGRTLPLVEAQRPVKAVAAAVRAELRPGVPLVAMGISEQRTLLFYADHRVEWMTSPFRLLSIVCYLPRAVLVTRPQMLGPWAEYLRSYIVTPPVLRHIVQRGDLVALWMDAPASCKSPLVGR